MYYSDYDTEPIGGGNPYWRCVHCHRSDPAINGQLSGHRDNCAYRVKKEAEIEATSASSSYSITAKPKGIGKKSFK